MPIALRHATPVAINVASPISVPRNGIHFLSAPPFTYNLPATARRRGCSFLDINERDFRGSSRDAIVAMQSRESATAESDHRALRAFVAARFSRRSRARSPDRRS